jgi:hypothetical protein
LLCAVKVLLTALRSTLTVLASRMGGLYRFALEEQLLVSQRALQFSCSDQRVLNVIGFSDMQTIRSLPNTAVIAKF